MNSNRLKPEYCTVNEQGCRLLAASSGTAGRLGAHARFRKAASIGKDPRENLIYILELPWQVERVLNLFARNLIRKI